MVHAHGRHKAVQIGRYVRQSAACVQIKPCSIQCHHPLTKSVHSESDMHERIVRIACHAYMFLLLILELLLPSHCPPVLLTCSLSCLSNILGNGADVHKLLLQLVLHSRPHVSFSILLLCPRPVHKLSERFPMSHCLHCKQLQLRS